MIEDLKNKFDEDGYVVVRDLLKASDVEFYREVVKDAIRERNQFDEREHKDKSKKFLFQNFQYHLKYT